MHNETIYWKMLTELEISKHTLMFSKHLARFAITGHTFSSNQS